MGLKLFIHPLSQPARSLLLFCRVNSIPYEEIVVDLIKGEHKTEEYKVNVSPFQKVPVIDHDGFRLTESVAILRYLARTFPVPDHWYPKESKAQAKIDAYMAWQHLNLRAYGSMHFQTAYVIPRNNKEPVNQKKLANFRKGLDISLQDICDVWLRESPFIGGNKISMADLLAVTEMEQPGMGGYDVKSFNNKIGEYMEKVRQELQPHYDEVHAAVHKIQAKALQKRS